MDELYLDPHEEDLMETPQYLLTIEEKQAHLIFNEVAKATGAQNLCLPFLFNLKVSKGEPQHSLAHMVQAEQHAGHGYLTQPHVIDYKFL